ncbi:MAG: RNA polymerase sigma factor [Candidatus Omnitrophota bacterium]
MALSQVSPELIEACRGGDRAAMENLLQEISPDLYRIIFSILRDHDDTDEVLQETLIRLFRYIGALKDIQRFPAWVMRIAVNQVQTYRVRKNRNRLYEVEDSREISNSAVVLSGMAPENPCEKLAREQMRAEITSAMDSLPNRQKTATVLFELEGMSIKEIANIMQCSEGAVKFGIHEGRKKLKMRLFHLVQGLRWGKRHSTASGSSIPSRDFGLRELSASQSGEPSASEASAGR